MDLLIWSLGQISIYLDGYLVMFFAEIESQISADLKWLLCLGWELISVVWGCWILWLFHDLGVEFIASEVYLYPYLQFFCGLVCL